MKYLIACGVGLTTLMWPQVAAADDGAAPATALVEPLTDPQLAQITGTALGGNPLLRRIADADAAGLSRHVNAIAVTMFDTWLADVAAPLIVSNQLTGQ